MLTALAAAGALAAPATAAIPFAPTSVWNAPVPASATLDPSSNALVADLQRQRRTWSSWINTTSNSTPIYTVGASQATTKVILDTTSAPALANVLTAVPIPAGALPAIGGDGNMVVWQPSTDTLWEFWHMTLQLDGWHAAWGGRMLNVSTSPGYYRDRYTGGTASERWFWGSAATSLSLAGGVITAADLAAGRIDHALYLSIPQPRQTYFAWPAQRTDGNLNSPNAIPEGAHLRIDPKLNLATVKMPAITRMLAEAAQRYGIIVNNSSLSISFRAEDTTTTGVNPYAALFGNQNPNQLLASFPWDRLQVLKMDLHTAAG
jgi:hypothetical protein